MLARGDDFSFVARSVLERAFRKPEVGRRSGGSKSSGQQVWYCRLYQSGKWDKGDSREDVLPSGRKVTVSHICAECWLKSRRRASHPQNDDKFPLRKD